MSYVTDKSSRENTAKVVEQLIVAEVKVLVRQTPSKLLFVSLRPVPREDNDVKN